MIDPWLLTLLVVFLGLVFDYTNGFHDAANVVSTVIATKVLLPFTAIVMAVILNTLGATQISKVAATITSGLIQPQKVTELVILSALVGAIVWNVLTWYFGIPSSSSYALVGGLIGAAFQYEGSSIVIWKGLIQKVIIPMVISPILGFLLSYLLMKGVSFVLKKADSKKFTSSFRYIQIGSAGLVALSHGINDAQKSMGIITLGLFSAGMISTIHIPFWVIISCAAVMGLGTAFGGFRIIRTMGFRLTRLQPSQGFAAELGASSVILTASFLGMPISSTHLIAGGIMGVGAAKKFSAVNWKLTNQLVLAWILTIPGAAFVGALSYYVINLISS